MHIRRPRPSHPATTCRQPTTPCRTYGAGTKLKHGDTSWSLLRAGLTSAAPPALNLRSYRQRATTNPHRYSSNASAPSEPTPPQPGREINRRQLTRPPKPKRQRRDQKLAQPARAGKRQEKPHRAPEARHPSTMYASYVRHANTKLHPVYFLHRVPHDSPLCHREPQPIAPTALEPN